MQLWASGWHKSAKSTECTNVSVLWRAAPRVVVGFKMSILRSLSEMRILLLRRPGKLITETYAFSSIFRPFGVPLLGASKVRNGRETASKNDAFSSIFDA